MNQTEFRLVHNQNKTVSIIPFSLKEIRKLFETSEIESEFWFLEVYFGCLNLKILDLSSS